MVASVFNDLHGAVSFSIPFTSPSTTVTISPGSFMRKLDPQAAVSFKTSLQFDPFQTCPSRIIIHVSKRYPGHFEVRFTSHMSNA
jgi:hypothetical protein